MLLPNPMANHYDRMRVRRQIFFRQDSAPEDRFHTHYVEIITAHQFAPDDLRTLIVVSTAAFTHADARRRLSRCAEIGKTLVLLANIQVVQVGKLTPHFLVLLTAPKRLQQFARVFHWER